MSPRALCVEMGSQVTCTLRYLNLEQYERRQGGLIAPKYPSTFSISEESASRAFCNSVFVKAKYLYYYIALFKSGTLKPDRQYLARLLSSDRYAHAASFNPRVFRGVSAAYVNGACGAGCGFDCCLCLPLLSMCFGITMTVSHTAFL